MKRDCVSLTTNGCLYMSMGFKQTYTMQVLTFSSSSDNRLNLILYDGVAYIGAVLPNQDSPMTNTVNASHRETDFITESMSKQRGILYHHREDIMKTNLRIYDVVKVIPNLIIPNEPVYKNIHI